MRGSFQLGVFCLVAAGCTAPQTMHAETHPTHARPPRAIVRSAASQPTSERQLVKTADMVLLTKEHAAVAKKAEQLARESGGYTVDSECTESASRLTLKVPQERFEAVLARLRGLGQVDRVQISGRDVSAEIVDLEIRLDNAQKARQRYLELLARAESVTAALPVQKEVTKVTTTIEQLEGQLELLRHQVAMSTLRLALERPVRPGILGWVFYGLYRGVAWLFVWN